MKIPEAKQLKSGTWYIQLRIDGKSHYISGSKKIDVENEAYYIKSTYKTKRASTVGASRSVTLRQACAAYVADRSNTLSPSTLRGYNTIINTRFQSVMDKPIRNITNWQALCNAEAKCVSAKTLKNSWALIRNVLNENGINASVTLPQVEVNERPYLTPAEIKVFCEALKGQEVEIPALLALHGLRRSEIIALDWKNINLKRNDIFVKGAAVFDADNKLITKKTNKNKTSTRHVPIIIPQLHDALEAVENKSGKVTDYNPNNIWRQVNKICKANGLPEVGCHGLRHSFASLCYSKGVREKTAMMLGGWADYGTMRKIYTHLAGEDVAAEISAMRDFFD